MKTTLLITSLTCLAVWQTSVQGATQYWDSNGNAPGAGNPPDSVSGWEADAFWSADPSGSSATAAWVEGNKAVFSAGTDATDPFTVTIGASVTPSEITFEEGLATITGGTINMTNVAADIGEFPIIANTNAIINAGLSGISCGFKKTGSGWLTLGGDNLNAGGFGINGTNIIAEGAVVVTHGSALGASTAAPTIVSNGATLQVNITAVADTIILNGNGVTNGGAFRDALPGNGACPSQLILASDARIEHVGNGNFSFTGLYLDGTNNANGFANLTIGGDGTGFHRFNIGGYPAIRLGQGALIKEGLCQHNFEVPNDIGAIYFNRGRLNWRQSFGGGTGVVHVAASAGQIMATANAITIPNDFDLAAGANVEINENLANSPLTFSGVISGPGGLSKVNDGRVVFNRANTYQGNTIIQFGSLALGVNGSISNSPVIEVRSLGGTNAVFDVSAVPGGFVLQSGQTLKGAGSVAGNVTALGTIAPGASVGTLTFSNNLTLNGDLQIEVDKSLSPASDAITVLGTVNNVGSGTVTVTRIGGPSLQVGDNFPIFNQAVPGAQTMTVTGAGATWTNKLWVNGSIEVLVAPPPDVPATNLTIQATGPASISLGGLGAANSPYSVYAASDVTLPMTNWTKIGITNSDAGGVIQFLDSQATNAQRFYRFGQP